MNEKREKGPPNLPIIYDNPVWIIHSNLHHNVLFSLVFRC